MKNIKIIDIKREFDKLYDFDLYRIDQKRHKVYARKTFTVFCRKLDFTYELIGATINVDHATCMHYIKTIHTISRIDKIIFNDVIDSFGLKMDKFHIDELIKPTNIKRIALDGILSEFNVLLELNDIDIKEFKETRLKPFMRMKRTLIN